MQDQEVEGPLEPAALDKHVVKEDKVLELEEELLADPEVVNLLFSMIGLRS